MSVPVTVIIPTLNEQARVVRAIESAFAAGAAEVIVTDGGSRDDTVALARERVQVISGESIRSRQMNRAAGEARYDQLIFLHADTTLPPNGAALVQRALERGALFGGFSLGFEENTVGLRFAELVVNSRMIFTRCPRGDQAQFIRRDTFERVGGFRSMSFMEDYELARRMARFKRTIILPQKIRTSGRRFLEKGVLRATIINWSIIARYRIGADVETLARCYRQ